ncbi:MAG: hypothetical protein DRP42_06220 [Tenericutes bacterium]|nr:MAG: hypothetical protein DRP42_06220 [Mycoplasmatota bacterium]
MLRKAILAVNKQKLIEMQPNYWCKYCETFPTALIDGKCGNPLESHLGELEPCLNELTKVTVIILED